MAEPLVFAIPGDPETRTGGYAYDRRVKAGLEGLGRPVRWLSLPGGFPRPEPADLAASLRLLEALPAGTLVLADGLAYGALPAEALARLSLRVVALVHHPLALETGLSVEDSLSLEFGERAALAEAHGVIVTSTATARTLVERYGVPREAITVAEPGTDRVSWARGTGGSCRPGGSGKTVGLVSVATVSPRKGFPALIEGLGAVAGLDWQCRIVGSLDRAPDHAAEVQRAAARAFGERIVFEGEVSEAEVSRFYDEADVFVLASLHEGYGMAFAEALARGLPVVGFAAGAVPSVVPEDAGLLVPPGDVAALGAALREVIGDAALRARLGEGARKAAGRLPDWENTARQVDGALRKACPESG